MSTFRHHEMLPDLKHDDRARLSFVKAFRGHLSSKVMPGTYQVYAARVEPAFRRAVGRTPGTEQEVREHMTLADDLVFKRGIDAPTLRIDGMTLAGA